MEKISIQWLKWLADVCKAMKTEYICLSNDLIIGTDKTFSSVVLVDSKNTFYKPINLGIPTTVLQTFIKEIPEFIGNKPVGDNIYIDYNKGYICVCDEDYLQFDSVLGDKIVELFVTLTYSKSISLMKLNYPNLREDEEFERCLALKSAQGAVMYHKDGYCMSLFSGLLPINKADKVDLIIYPNEKYFTAEFKITKKKPNIEMYCMFRYLYL